MNTLRFLALAAALSCALPAVAQPAGSTRTLPPVSLGQWYPPQSERQVWLHTMFSLRTAMQAVGEYAALEDGERLHAWAERFVEAYRRLPEMVPEWEDEVESAWAERLLDAARTGDFEGVNSALRKVGVSCRSCHREYRAAAAALYRIPDYRQVLVEDSDTLEELPYAEFMERLASALNRIKIALRDNLPERGLAATEQLNTGLHALAESCGGCHKDAAPRERILGAALSQSIERLRTALADGSVSAGGRALGEVGAYACGRCHSIHRLGADLRRQMVE